jgi:hypothetical protein
VSGRAKPDKGASSEEVDRLFSGPLEEFTAKRDALVKRLKADKDRDAADAVAKLRKPTVAAWLVNQIAHRNRKAMERFASAADELRQAQEEAVSGQGAQHLRKAQREERQAVDELVVIARRIGDGSSEPTFDRVRQTFETAVADPESLAAVAAGRLEKELRPGDIAGVPRGPIARKKGDGNREQRELAAARQQFQELSRQLERAKAAEAERRDEKERAEQQVRDARAALKEARSAARKLETKLRSVQRRLDAK